MRLSTTQSGNVLVVNLEGSNLDRSSQGLFKQDLSKHLRPGVKIALGLGRVRHADGPGLSAMLSLHQDVKALGGDMKVFSLHHPSLRSTYQKLRLHRRMDTFNHEEEAVRAFVPVE